ncbi:histidine kinase dimerization/phosphoacceptor domain -containing protein [Desulforhopalus sp. 52FAK]
MFEPIKKRLTETIGNKLFAMFVLVLLLTIGPIALHVLNSVNRFGEYSTRVSEDQIRKHVVAYLSHLGHEQGERYEAYLSEFSSVAELVAGQAEVMYQNLAAHASLIKTSVPMEYQAEKKIFFSSDSEVVPTLYWGKGSLSTSILSEINALKTIDPLFVKAQELLPDSVAIHLVTDSGIAKYSAGGLRGEDLLLHFPQSTDIDLHETVAFSIFSDTNIEEKNRLWTSIYKGYLSEELILTAASSFRDEEGQLKGVVGIDLPLKTIVDDIIQAAHHEDGKEGKILFSFIVNSDGAIVVYPMELLSLFGMPSAVNSDTANSELLSYNLRESTNPDVVNLIEKILETKCVVQQLFLEDENYFVASESLSSQGWKLVMVAKESDLLASVSQIKQALGGVTSSLKVKFILYTFILVLLLLICCYLAVRHVVGPIQKLSLLAQSVGKGDLSKKSCLTRNDEIGVLSDAMNEMIDSLAEAESFKKEYLNKLKNGINERTADLHRKTLLLSEVMRKVHNESEKRKKISLVLKEREKQLLTTMEASLAGICIIQGNKFKYVNSAIEEMFGYSKEELVDKKGPIDLVATEFNAEVMQRLTLREKGEVNQKSAPHHVKCRRKNNEVFDVEVDGSFITWKGAPASVGTLVDISDHVKDKEKISQNEKRLKGLLDEKDILLREVYHRTKNNMLVIISMLALQMDEIEDEKAIKIFEEMEHRIRAMALVHENLYQSKNLVEINLGEYLAKMARTQVDHMTFSDQIEVRSDYCQVTAPFDKVVPLGLIVSELITNAVKYAFPAGRKGIIRLQLTKVNGLLHLIVEDNGVGLPPEIETETPTSFGLQITANMITKQLGGTFEVQKKKGTAFHIKFTLKNIHG